MPEASKVYKHIQQWNHRLRRSRRTQSGKFWINFNIDDFYFERHCITAQYKPQRLHNWFRQLI